MFEVKVTEFLLTKLVTCAQCDRKSIFGHPFKDPYLKQLLKMNLPLPKIALLSNHWQNPIIGDWIFSISRNVYSH
jgi:hypothetical protein